jgi:hypothetical protein
MPFTLAPRPVKSSVRPPAPPAPQHIRAWGTGEAIDELRLMLIKDRTREMTTGLANDSRGKWVDLEFLRALLRAIDGDRIHVNESKLTWKF